MQIDGHHAATYVAARLAGFGFKDAETIAYAAQYVDDATNAGVIQFDSDDYLYSRIASAHKMVDYDNFVDVENHLSWIPFHFLPGNGSLPADQSPNGDAYEKLVCTPDSSIARDMLRQAMLDRGKPRGLHRLGIAMHVYADTFAHQGFIGSLHSANQAQSVTCGDPEIDAQIKEQTKEEIWKTVSGNLKAVWQILGRLVALLWHEKKWPPDFIASFLKTAPVGHAAVDVYPDQPYLAWQYTNFKGDVVKRNNTEVFVVAVDMMVKAMQAWRGADISMNLSVQGGMSDSDRKVVSRLFKTSNDISGEKRHATWMDAIKQGAFSFGNEIPAYIDKGPGSWKDQALGNQKRHDNGYERYAYSPYFLKSNWKLFHDALQAHRHSVIHEVLPVYGICAA